jgi:tRNA pseudouridine38-40 synthase
MARYHVILAYDGTLFKGSQRQAKSRTVQGEFENALRSLTWTGKSVLMAGRTDSGVHASGQVVAFDLEWKHQIDALLRALNSNLPADMAVQEIYASKPDFHPRFDAQSRLYRYRIFCRAVRDPLREKFVWRVWPEVKAEALLSVAPVFIGKYDYREYGTPARKGGTCERTVMKSAWYKQEDEWHYEVQADAFLYRMVRRMVFIQVAVAQGLISVEDVARSVKEPVEAVNASVLPSGIAPACGLSLAQVTY